MSTPWAPARCGSPASRSCGSPDGSTPGSAFVPGNGRSGDRFQDEPRDPLLPPDAVDRFAAALASGDARGAVGPLLGRGAGLTPAGDDLVAGALAALRAVAPDSPPADALGAAVRALAQDRTTRLSSALLAAADEGAVIPEAAAVLRALSGVGDLDAALGRLAAVGHTSGSYLAAGLLVGARLAEDLVGAA